jgi:hypothetical protein
MWCGNGAVVGYWDNVLTLVGLNNDSVRSVRSYSFLLWVKRKRKFYEMAIFFFVV